ncbi:MAG: hypothetical protein AB7G25_06700 [Sphingomonadaceae bacterium]
MSRLSDRMARLERGNLQSLPLAVRAWLGQSLSPTEQAELAALPADPAYTPPTEAEMAGWSLEAREWFSAR